MTTLLFNSNYLLVLLPPQLDRDALFPSGAIYRLRCVYNYWPVTDLHHEWGVDDCPATAVRWAAAFSLLLMILTLPMESAIPLHFIPPCRVCSRNDSVRS